MNQSKRKYTKSEFSEKTGAKRNIKRMKLGPWKEEIDRTTKPSGKKERN